MNRVFRVEVEVGHMKGCQLPKNAAGAFVNVYVSALVLRDAMDLAEQCLIEDHYRPINISAAYEFELEGVDYDSDEVGYPGNADLEELRIHGGRWYGPFNTFPHEGKDTEENESAKPWDSTGDKPAS